MQDNLVETVEIKSYEQSQEQFISKLKNSFLYDVEKIKLIKVIYKCGD